MKKRAIRQWCPVAVGRSYLHLYVTALELARLPKVLRAAYGIGAKETQAKLAPVILEKARLARSEKDWQSRKRDLEAALARARRETETARAQLARERREQPDARTHLAQLASFPQQAVAARKSVAVRAGNVDGGRVSMTRVEAAWGDAAPDWVRRLAQACDASSQTKVGARLGISSPAISLVLGKRYPARMDRIAATVLERLPENPS